MSLCINALLCLLVYSTMYIHNTPQNMIFFSKQAVFNGKKAIRGGIPVVFRK